MTAKTIMVQGTGSSVGKSLLVTALCRILRQDGYNVAPFKAQNMSLNSGVTPDGAEIGRSQIVQAEAAGVLPAADMNPILLKPEVDYRSQIIIRGRPVGKLESKNFNRRKDSLWQTVTESLDMLRSEFDVVVIEGAGSPAEINLRQGDIVNMEVALYAKSPVLLAADIDKGGVFASVYGTVMLIAPEERELIKGVIVNKFRGDVSILKPGLAKLEELTDIPVMGVIPYFKDIYIPEEDAASEGNYAGKAKTDTLLDIAVIAFPHISNFDDFDPLKQEPAVGLRYVRKLDDLGTPDLIILPGTKTTVADLEYIRSNGIADRIVALADEGVAVIGICGGYQMLGERIIDIEGVESVQPVTKGLRLLPVSTQFAAEKQTHLVSGVVTGNHGLLLGAKGLSVQGYEIHMGMAVDEIPGIAPIRLSERSGQAVEAGDGMISKDGWIMGTYLHSLFHNTELRRCILTRIAERKGLSLSFEKDTFSQSEEYDKLAELVRLNLDIDALYRTMDLRNG